MFTVIPEWLESGLLPITNNFVNSPYNTTSEEFVRRFATSFERIVLLNKWLDYRELLRPYIAGGFQWINGSFVEDIEKRQKHSPRDIDLVDFILPNELKMMSFQDYQLLGTSHQIDNYIVELPSYEKLSQLTTTQIEMFFIYLTERVAYWSLWWGHTRQEEPKGFVKIPFSEHNDILARELLYERELEL